MLPLFLARVDFCNFEEVRNDENPGSEEAERVRLGGERGKTVREVHWRYRGLGHIESPANSILVQQIVAFMFGKSGS